MNKLLIAGGILYAAVRFYKGDTMSSFRQDAGEKYFSWLEGQTGPGVVAYGCD